MKILLTTPPARLIRNLYAPRDTVLSYRRSFDGTLNCFLTTSRQRLEFQARLNGMGQNLRSLKIST